MTLPLNPLPLTVCVAEGGDVLGEVIRILTRPGVTVAGNITLEREVIPCYQER